jgi:hypothetical protein
MLLNMIPDMIVVRSPYLDFESGRSAFSINLVSGIWLLWDVAFYWITTMLGISILTTIYGHVVEGRALVD